MDEEKYLVVSVRWLLASVSGQALYRELRDITMQEDVTGRDTEFIRLLRAEVKEVAEEALSRVHARLPVERLDLQESITSVTP